MFTRKTITDTEWSLKKDNLKVNEAKLNEPTLAVLAGISKEKGVEHYKIFPRSVNIPKFKEYLTELRAASGDDLVCLFMDQLSTHTSEASKKAMKELGFKWIYNVAYSPEYNPIELVFSKIKQKFKALRARKLTGLIQDEHVSMVHQAIKSVRKKDITNCVDHVA